MQEALVRERLTVSDDDALESRLASVDLDNPDEVLQVGKLPLLSTVSPVY